MAPHVPLPGPPMMPWPCHGSPGPVFEPPPWAEVALSVYELNGAKALNAVTETVGLGGAYHVGIEVYWLEWSYGWNFRGTGVHVVPIGQSRIGKFKERISLGRTPLPPHEVFNVLAQLRREWPGQEYHYLRQNCGHFCAELSRRLYVPGEIPSWVTVLAETGDWLSQVFGVSLEGPDVEADIEEDIGGHNLLELLREDPVVAKNELEWQWAQEHTFERARNAAQQDFQNQMMIGARVDAPPLVLWHPHPRMTGL
mmetsp:Transcript_82416/g.214743  ORF Transcript_82416/g.214743 Transcript_82416/m.214743 type:complete len:254 (-) Transcript_82416:471-1232(-)